MIYDIYPPGGMSCGVIRGSIIRVCEGQGWPLPALALDDAAELQALKDLLMDVRCARHIQLRSRAAAAEFDRLVALPIKRVVEAEGLRQEAAELRDHAHHQSGHDAVVAAMRQAAAVHRRATAIEH